MNIKYKLPIISLFFGISPSFAQQKIGAVIPWITYEAETMKTTGILMGPKHGPYLVETESSGQRCIKLNQQGQFVQFTSSANANSMVIRYSLPDGEDGNGRSSTIGIYKNGTWIKYLAISSHYSWLYGKYPFTNNPIAGTPRHFYDEVRVKDLLINKGDVIQIRRDDNPTDNAAYCIIDLVDLEQVALPIKKPANALSLLDTSIGASIVNNDYTEALNKCIVRAMKSGKSVWIPAGTFKISGDINLPANVTIKGAGQWYSELVGDQTKYTDASKRVRLVGNGSNIHIADFAIIGKLNYRSDKERNDGIVGSFGINSTISNIWIEHTKVGIWVENSKNLKISGCRLRNTMADGINFCVGMTESIIDNCTARGTGDDCFAIWPTVFLKQLFSPGHNLIINCTAQLPYLANGVAIYGGDSNEIKNCAFSDISQGSAILISTTFPTANNDKSIDNNFKGTTAIEHCFIATSGGFDHEWGWRAAVEICLDKRSISGLQIKNLTIKNSFSNGLSIIAKNEINKIGLLTNATIDGVNITNYGIGVKNKYGLYISKKASGRLVIHQCQVAEIKNESSGFSIIR